MDDLEVFLQRGNTLAIRVKRLRLAMEMLGETATDIKKLNRHAGQAGDLRRKGRKRVGQGGSIGTLVINVKTVGARKRMEADDGHVGLGQCNRRQQGVVAPCGY